jgi:5-methylcytosine-specific restriction endonuclease McrA
MNHADRRRPFEFSYETKKEALLRSPVCEGCGKPESKDEPLHADHVIPIWFAIKYPVFALEVINSLANCRILCKKCHEKRNHYDTTEILSLAHIVVIRFVELERAANGKSN